MGCDQPWTAARTIDETRRGHSQAAVAQTAACGMTLVQYTIGSLFAQLAAILEAVRKERRMKDTQKAGTEQRMSESRHIELKQMLDNRRREIQAEVQGKMRGVREEGAWGGKPNEVLDAVESAGAGLQG